MRSLGLTAFAFAVAFVLLAGGPLGSRPAHAQMDVRARYLQANQFYRQGDTRRAIEAYRFVLTQRPNGYVYYNLGNAYFRQGRRGWAIWCYERAMRLLPRDPDIRTNLDFLNSLNEDRFEYPVTPLSLAQITDRLSFRELMWGYLGGYALSFAAASLLVLSRRRWRFLRIAVLLFGLLTLGSLFCLGFKWHQEQVRYAIIVEPRAEVFNGPGETFVPLFVLHEGAKVEALKNMPGWMEIRTPDARRGWIRRDMIAEI